MERKVPINRYMRIAKEKANETGLKSSGNKKRTPYKEPKPKDPIDNWQDDGGK